MHRRLLFLGLIVVSVASASWALAECVSPYPGNYPCYCASYTGPIYFTVITPDRPCNVTCYWGPWVGRGTANWNNFEGGQKFLVRMQKTKPDNVQLTLCAGPDNATNINGPYKYNPASGW